MAASDVCPYCRADLMPHCTNAACPWLVCPVEEAGCGALVDLAAHRLLNRDRVPVPWPFTLPDES